MSNMEKDPIANPITHDDKPPQNKEEAGSLKGNNSNDDDTKSPSQSAALGAIILMIGQISTKLITFIINQLLIRFISAHIFGITSFMETVASCALFYSREGIRLACQRASGSSGAHVKIQGQNQSQASVSVSVTDSIISLSLIPVIIGIPITIILITTQLSTIRSYEYANCSCLALALSVMIELSTEPFYNLNQQRLNFKLRAKAETTSLIIKCIVQMGVILYAYSDNTGYYILAYALAQLSYSIVLFLVYYLNNNHIKLHKFYFDPALIKYWLSLLIQLAFKYALTEGDRFILTYLCSTEEQGIFALVNNYGSLIARLLFAPIEESIRVSLTKLFTTSKEDESQKKPQMISILYKTFKLYFYLLSIVIIFAPFNSSYFLTFLIGSKWTSSLQTLQTTFMTYWYYIPFLAINGILEAAFYSISHNASQIHKYSQVMIGCSIVYFIALWTFIKVWEMSLIGLIMANVLNMMMRIWYCSYVLDQFLRPTPGAGLGAGLAPGEGLSTVFADKNYIYAITASITIYSIHYQLIGNTVYNFQTFLQSAALACCLVLIFLYIEKALVISVVKNLLLKIKRD